jgi:hypothetical protein
MKANTSNSLDRPGSPFTIKEPTLYFKRRQRANGMLGIDDERAFHGIAKLISIKGVFRQINSSEQETGIFRNDPSCSYLR